MAIHHYRIDEHADLLSLNAEIVDDSLALVKRLRDEAHELRLLRADTARVIAEARATIARVAAIRTRR
jgi:hypothetical protein